MNEVDEVEPPLGVLFGRKRGKTKLAKKATEPENSRRNVSVSMFDDSVENHLRVMHKISELCGEEERDPIPETDLQRLQSSTTFLR